jgi:ubiquinone/menaquinone biosynthesis C-methylase UbiE
MIAGIGSLFWLANEKPYIEQLICRARHAQLALDLGCGTGTYCSVLEKHCASIGVDPSLRMLGVARRQTSSNTSFVCAQASSLPLVNERLDIVVAARSLCHEPDSEGAFGELARITRIGGICILSDVHAQHQYPRTRIPFGSYDVHIETFKRTPEQIIQVAGANARWGIEFQREFRWDDLIWKPEDVRFSRVDTAGRRAIFFVILFRKVQ